MSRSVKAREVDIRAAAAPDSDAIVRLLGQLGYDRDQQSVESDLATGDGGDVIVAVDGDRVVGMLALKIQRQFHWGASVASIESLVVDESARSGGVGSALVDLAVQRAQTAHCLLIEVHSNRDRTRARRFYEREGFTVTSNYFVRALA
jgi:PhnO protein